MIEMIIWSELKAVHNYRGACVTQGLWSTFPCLKFSHETEASSEGRTRSDLTSTIILFPLVLLSFVRMLSIESNPIPIHFPS